MIYLEIGTSTLILAFFTVLFVISFYIRHKFVSLHRKYSLQQASNNLTGCEITYYLLSKLDLKIKLNIIEPSKKKDDNLSNSYDPRAKTINLTQDVCNSSSLSSTSIATHEIGHVLQQEEGYPLFKFLIFIYPFADFGASVSWVLVIVGLLFPTYKIMLVIGLLFVLIALIYQLLQLPLEKDASQRAVKLLIEHRLINEEELSPIKDMLKYAALSFLASPANLFFELFNSLLGRS